MLLMDHVGFHRGITSWCFQFSYIFLGASVGEETGTVQQPVADIDGSYAMVFTACSHHAVRVRLHFSWGPR